MIGTPLPLIDQKKPNKEVFLKIYIGMQYPVKKIVGLQFFYLFGSILFDSKKSKINVSRILEKTLLTFEVRVIPLVVVQIIYGSRFM
jgi:hypothetical protein